MLIDSALVVALGGAFTAICTGIAAVLAGINGMHKRKVAALEQDLADERRERAEERREHAEDVARLDSALTVSRAETDVARRERDEVRREKDDEIHRIEAARRADRLQHEADMQARTTELRGGQQ